MAATTQWSAALARWLQQDRLALLVIVFATLMQVVIAAHMFAPGELAGDDMTIHLAEISGIARSLASGELDLWNPSANGGFASGYFYQFLPQLVCAILYLLLGWLISLSTLFKLTVVFALLGLPLAVYRAMRVIGANTLVAATAGLGASTVFATSGWGAGIDSLFSTGLYTQAFALVFYPLALAYAARYLIEGTHVGRALIFTLLTGFCHPFVAFAIAPPLLFVPWLRIGLKNAAIRSAVLFAGALLGSAPLWLPILVHYDAFGGFPARVRGEEGIPYRIFFPELKRGAYLDVSRRAVTTALVFAGLPILLLKRGRILLPLYLSGATFAAFIMLGPVVGKTEGDLLPAVRFLGPMQLFLGAAGWAALAIGVSELIRLTRGQAPKVALRVGAVVVGAVVLFLVVELGAGVAVRSASRVRTVHSFEEIRRPELGRVIEFLDTRPPGRVLAASEFGSGSHWWMYLPYVYAGLPATRAYGGAALQSSPNFVFLRKADIFRQHGLYATRYLIARDANAEGERYGERFAKLDATIIYRQDGYRIYELADAAMFRAVSVAGWLDGDRKTKTKTIMDWTGSARFATNAALVEGDPIAPLAAPENVTIEETRHSRRSHAATVRVSGEAPAIMRLAVTYHPGWRVTIDGEPAAVRRASPAFVAVLVPPGSHTIRFTFVRPVWTWLLYVLLIAAFLGVAWWRRRRAAAAAAAAVVIALMSPGEARAQPDSYPAPVDVAFHDDGRAIVATRAGLLVRKRPGEPFAYVCPDAGGSKPGAFAPKVAIRRDGTFAATSYAGLRQSRDGCELERTPVFGAAGDRVRKDLWFSDLEVTPPDTLWAVTADAHRDNDVYVSREPHGVLVSAKRSSDRFWYISIVATPDGSRTYASGYMVAGRQEAEVLKLLMVDDQVAPALGLEAGRSGRLRVMLAPSHDDVFVVAEGALEPRGDVMYVSRDGASSFSEVFRSSAPVVGLVRTQSGETFVATEQGVHRAAPDQLGFALVASAQLACLARSEADELIACRADAAGTGELLSRLERRDGGFAFVPYLLAKDVGAPCGTLCWDAWERACAIFAADCSAAPTEALDYTPTAVEQARGRAQRFVLLTGGLLIAAILALLAIVIIKTRRAS